LRAPDRLILMGVFGAAHGVRGEVRVKSLTGEPGAIGAYGALTDKARARTFVFEALRPLKNDMVVARLAGVSTREGAEALNGVEIFARRDQLPPPAHDEFYLDDLVGLEAVGTDGAPLGLIVSLMNYGAGDILEIAPADGGETLLLPFTRRVAPAIDFAAGRIVINRPREVEDEPDAESPSDGC
jgi:16S rRNA processing protein RimM